MNLLFAGSNLHKLSELNSLLSPEFKLTAPNQKLAVVESGATFYENALIKARAYHQQFRKSASAILSDDSGLVVEAMPEIMGVGTADFAQELPHYRDRIEKLLTLTAHLKSEQERQAYFCSVLCLYYDEGQYFFFEGRCSGYLGTKPLGEGGFAYDPLFIPRGESQTFAENPELKNITSHRAKAAAQLKLFLVGFSSPH